MTTTPPTSPPAGAPPILLERTWAGEPDRDVGPGVSISGGRLCLRGRGPGVLTGQGVTTHAVRDVVIDTVVRASGTSPAEGFGVFCRQSGTGRYIAWRVTTGRLLSVSAMDGTETLLGGGPLADGMVLHAEPGAANRFTVVAVGPALTLVLNQMVVTSVIVDPRYAEGHAGVMLEQREPTTDPRLEVEWFQVRAVLADQPHAPRPAGADAG